MKEGKIKISEAGYIYILYLTSNQKYLITMLLVLLSSYSSALSRSIYGPVLASLILGVIFFYHHFKFTKRFIWFSLGFFILFLVQTIRFSSFHPLFLIRIYCSILCAYFIIRLLNIEFFEYFEKVVFHLALISLPLFLLQQFFFDRMFFYNSFFERMIPLLETGGDVYSNSFIYTMKENFQWRNSGFAWEPGAFAAFLLPSMIINMSINKFHFNFRLIIMIIAIITTFSSMGYAVLGLIFFYYLVNINFRYTILLIPIIIAVNYYIINLPFMKEKVVQEYETVDIKLESAFSAETSSEFRALGRMASFRLDVQDFLKYPLIGIGGHEAALTQGSVRLQRTSGLGDYLVVFGSIGIVFLLFGLINTSKKLKDFFKTKGTIIIPVVILMISFSNGILTTPIFIVFQIFWLIPVRVKLKRSHYAN